MFCAAVWRFCSYQGQSIDNQEDIIQMMVLVDPSSPITGKLCGRWDTVGTSCTWWQTWVPCSSCPTCEWTWAVAAGRLCGPWWGSWSPGCPAESTGSWRRSWCTGWVSSGPSSSMRRASTLSSSFVLRSASGHPSPSSPPWFSSWGLKEEKEICSGQVLSVKQSTRCTLSSLNISSLCETNAELATVPKKWLFYIPPECRDLTFLLQPLHPVWTCMTDQGKTQKGKEDVFGVGPRATVVLRLLVQVKVELSISRSFNWTGTGIVF